MTEVAALEVRVTRIEDQITAGFLRIEGLLQSEIRDLKNEQIADLRKSYERLADDQRRLWDRLGDMERRENMRVGREQKGASIWHVVSGVIGGMISALGVWFSVKPH